MVELARDDMVTLAIAGERHQGWTSVSVTRSIDALSGSFELTLTERWPDRPERFVIEAGTACRVEISGETVIDGYIDRLSPEIDGQSHMITVSGRDRTGDLVDCAAIASPGSWSNRSVEAILTELAAPFGVTVKAEVSTGAPLKKFALQPAETVGQVIERLCRQRGLLAIAEPGGVLALTRPNAGAPVETIREGVNLLAGSGNFDVSNRFSDYRVKGQASGDDQANGKTVAAPSGKASDPGVKRYRPLIVIAEDQATLKSCETRALWEASTRAARSRAVSVTVNDWHGADGRLRACNRQVAIDAPSLFANATMLVEAVTFTFDQSGRKTVLGCVPRDAWQPEPVTEDAQPSRVGKGKAQRR